MSDSWRVIETKEAWLGERIIKFCQTLGDDAKKVENAWFWEKDGGIMVIVGDGSHRQLGGFFVGILTEHDPLAKPSHLLPREIVPPMRARVALDSPRGEPCTILRYFWRSDRVMVGLDKPDKEGRTIVSVWRQRTVAVRKDESDEDF